MPEVNPVLCGRYALGRPLGAGGMGCVWAAEHCATGRQVAVKVLAQALAGNPAAAARFHTEARAAARLNSKHIVQIFDHDLDPVVGPFIAMELLVGESLAQRLARQRAIPPAAVARIVLQVAKGLILAHEAGIIHRDLKPDNIFVAVDEDGGEVVKILDFGVAKTPLQGALGLTVDGYLVGTLAYMSPEQALGRAIDHRADLWALGIIAFEALVGQLPFADSNPIAQAMAICHAPTPIPSQFSPSLPVGFDPWFATAVNRDPALRFQSAGALATALATVCGGVHPDNQGIVEPDADRTSLSADNAAKYYVMSDEITVGPINASVLHSGIVNGRVPASALVWTEGWQEWRCARDLFDELSASSLASPSMLRDAPGVEALGARSILPLSAPPPSSVRASVPAERGDVASHVGAAANYFVSDGDKTIGPVRPSLLRRGIDARRVPSNAVVWRKGWDGWRSVEEVRSLLDHPSGPADDELRNEAGISCMGPPSCLPAEAPPRSRRASATLPIGWDDAGRKASGVTAYYVTNEGMTVGPVPGSLLLRGIEAGKVPLSAQIWTDGWEHWRLAEDVLTELDKHRSLLPEALRDAPGLEAIGPVSICPPSAPSTIAPPAKWRRRSPRR